MKQKIGFVGLGHMGTALVQNALDHGFAVAGYNRTREKTDAIKHPQFTPTISLKDLVATLKPPRIIWLMIAVGAPVEDIIFEKEGLVKYLEKGDCLIDGANSFYKDSQRRAEALMKKGITFFDCGTSGGVEGARNGASLMIGGDPKRFKLIEPLCKALARDNGYAYFGPSGAGHFVKMIHNGIEYGMMQAIAEGCAILQSSEFKPDLTKATQVWNNGSIIESSLIKWLNLIYQKDPHLTHTEPVIGSLGTGKWTVEAALAQGIPAHVIAAAVFARYESRPEAAFGRKVVQALRGHFGEHTPHERDAK